MPVVIFLVLAALVVHFFWWLVAIVVTVVAARLVGRWLAASEDREVARWRRDEEIAARADREHQLVMAGDERGVYGQYPPVRA